MSDGASSTVSTSRVDVGDVEIHLNAAGPEDAEPVLFLHGSGPGATGASNWEAVLADLGGRYRCLAPDVVGFGDSTHPDPPPAGLGPMTQLRIDTLIGPLDELKIDKVNLVGNSMGGIWSLGIVKQAPERVGKIVLMGAGGSPSEFFGESLPKLVNFRATFDMSKPWSITAADLEAITHEVLIVHGREDRFVKFGGGVYFFEHIPNSRLYGIGRCGHWTQIEQHDKFVAVLSGFLAGDL